MKQAIFLCVLLMFAACGASDETTPSKTDDALKSKGTDTPIKTDTTMKTDPAPAAKTKTVKLAIDGMT